MIVLDASVALKWFAPDEPLAAAASRVLDEVERAPQQFLVPDIFMAECLAVLCRMRGATAEKVQEAVELLESLGMSHIPVGHEVLQLAARYALEWKLSGYDAIYVALASLSGATWLTADQRAARRVKVNVLARVL
ncbi:MAG: type II toxin-antitoxin system VapC family toxin [Thermoanaerobaculia bacterium]